MSFSLPQASTEAPHVDAVALFVFLICAVLGLGVLIVMIVFLIRYREGTNVDRSNPPLSLEWLEITWTVIPTLLGLAMFYAGAREYYRVYSPPGEKERITLDVIGKQWMWIVYYPNGRREIGALHVPVGQKVRLRMLSEDVIHDFSVPAFRIKHDVVPGHYNYLWFEATQLGDFQVFCSEYCGTDHSRMLATLHVMDPKAYQDWLNAGSVEKPEERGKRLFDTMGCAGCHRGINVPAPRLEGLFGKPVTLDNGRTVVADEEYVRESILFPKAKIVSGFEPIMPTYDQRLKEEDLIAIIAYLRSLGGAP